YSAEEVNIAMNEGRLVLNAEIKVKTKVLDESGELKNAVVETTAVRVLFNELVPEKVGYINEVLTKKSLRDIIGRVLAVTDVPTTAKFLDDFKSIGYNYAFKGGLSFSLGDIMIP